MSTIKSASPAPDDAPSRAKRELVLLAVAVLAFVGLSVGALVLMGRPPTVRDPLKGVALPVGERPLALTLVHTNDTWGYLEVCGG